MKVTKNELGSMNVLLIPFILSIVGFFGALGFGVWAYMERQDYKDNSDQKAAAAVAVAEERLSSEKDNEFLEREKQPLREYKASSVFGGITFQYPKTWSAYLNDGEEEMELVMNPLVVSGNQESKPALRIKVERTGYEDALRRYEGNVKQGSSKASAFRLAKVPSVLGTRFDGEIEREKQGAAVVLPLRDKAIVITSESKDFLNDFDKIILPQLTFVP